MTDPEFGCPACESEKIAVRSNTRGYAYDRVRAWDEDGEPSEREPFMEAPGLEKTYEEMREEDQQSQYLEMTRFSCIACNNDFRAPKRLDAPASSQTYRAEVRLEQLLSEGRTIPEAVATVSGSSELAESKLEEMACSAAASLATNEGVCWLDEGDSLDLAREQAHKKLRQMVGSDVQRDLRRWMSREVDERLEEEAARREQDGPSGLVR